MTDRNFDEWLSKFRPSISSYDCEFPYILQ